MRIAVGRASAYDLYLTRTIKNATLVRAATGGGRAMIDLFLADNLEAAAGVRQPLVAYAKTDPNVRVLDGRFMVIQQAMGTPKGRDAGARYLRLFIEEMRASGFVAEALVRSNQPDAARGACIKLIRASAPATVSSAAWMQHVSHRRAGTTGPPSSSRAAPPGSRAWTFMAVFHPGARALLVLHCAVIRTQRYSSSTVH